VFELIRENFGGQNGMFRRLFGGGRAEVRLMPLVKEVDGGRRSSPTRPTCSSRASR
jgi:chromosome segregation ATPase